MFKSSLTLIRCDVLTLDIPRLFLGLLPLNVALSTNLYSSYFKLFAIGPVLEFLSRVAYSSIVLTACTKIEICFTGLLCSSFARFLEYIEYSRFSRFAWVLVQFFPILRVLI